MISLWYLDLLIPERPRNIAQQCANPFPIFVGRNNALASSNIHQHRVGNWIYCVPNLCPVWNMWKAPMEIPFNLYKFLFQQLSPSGKPILDKTVTVNPLCRQSKTSKKKSKKIRKRKYSKKKKKYSKKSKDKKKKKGKGRKSSWYVSYITEQCYNKDVLGYWVPLWNSWN